MCPGKPPEEIERKAEQTDGSEQHQLLPFGGGASIYPGVFFSRGFRDGGSPLGGGTRSADGADVLGSELFRQFEGMMRQFDSAFGFDRFGAPPPNWPPQDAWPRWHSHGPPAAGQPQRGPAAGAAPQPGPRPDVRVGEI